MTLDENKRLARRALEEIYAQVNVELAEGACPYLGLLQQLGLPGA